MITVFWEVESISKSADYSKVRYDCPAVLGYYSQITKQSQFVFFIKRHKSNQVCKIRCLLANNNVIDFGDQSLMDIMNYNIDPVSGSKNL